MRLVKASLLAYSHSRQYLPRKGTETFFAVLASISLVNDSRQYLPRKGTETLGSTTEVITSNTDSRQYLPRKGTETVPTDKQRVIHLWIPDNIYPARGRKQQRKHKSSSHINLFPTIFTPQGDGNRIYTTCVAQVFPLNSRQYLPRKGTETKLSDIKITLFSVSIPDNIYPARGRKQLVIF